MGAVYLAIIHYPVLDKQGEIVSTSITNLELHDVARSCMTFGVRLCYIVTPLEKQRGIAQQLVDHWKTGYGRQYNPHRAQALERICIKKAVSEVISDFRGLKPILIATSSKKRDGAIGYGQLRKWIRADPGPFLLLFGTGWGLPPDIVRSCERTLLPISGQGEYNHLPLRVAIGIILDRLFGARGEEDERND
jgi:hypothetical protein